MQTRLSPGSVAKEQQTYIAQLEARLARYENMENNFTDGQSLFVKISLEESFQMQSAVRDLIGHLEPDAALKEGSLYFAMQLLEMLSPKIEDINQFVYQQKTITHAYRSA